MAGINQYNETFLGNAPVPTVGTKSGAARVSGYDTRTNATGMPSGVQSFDPTANMKADAKVMTAAPNAAYTSGKDRRPAGVDSFNDAGV